MITATDDPAVAVHQAIHGGVESALVHEVYQRTKVEQKLAKLLARLYEVADEEEWCEKFDDEMEALGFDRRLREWAAVGDVEVCIGSVTKLVTVEVGVEAYSEDSAYEQADDALSDYAIEMVKEMLEADPKDSISTEVTYKRLYLQ